MITFKVDDMSCNHCVSTITQALRAVDAQAQVSVDLATHKVTVQPYGADAQALQDAIAQAGYTPTAWTEPSAKPAQLHEAGRRGCCRKG